MPKKTTTLRRSKKVARRQKLGAAKGSSRVAVATSDPSKKVSKSDFIRARSHMGVNEIIRQGAEAGLELKVGLIYNIRAAEKRNRGKDNPMPMTPSATMNSAPLPLSGSLEIDSAATSEFCSTVLRIGFDRAEALLAKFKSSFAPFLGETNPPAAPSKKPRALMAAS